LNAKSCLDGQSDVLLLEIDPALLATADRPDVLRENDEARQWRSIWHCSPLHIALTC
jgi:hypothetical protein